MKPSNFQFEKTDKIGEMAAERDTALRECYVDTGDIKSLMAKDADKSIVLGRTGSGKTALLRRLNETFKGPKIMLSPETLCITHICSSTVLQHYKELGLKLEPIFRLLWRHILIAQVIRIYLGIKPGQESGWGTKFRALVKDRIVGQRHQRALDYLNEWGERFLISSEEVIQEVLRKVQEDEAVGMNLKGWVQAKLENMRAKEEKSSVRKKGEAVMEHEQMRLLSDTIDLLSCCLADTDNPYLIIIDQLDENWTDDGTRCYMVRGLVDAILDLHRIRQVKVVASIRVDLLARAYNLTRDPGFQEEKYEDMELKLVWTEASLSELIERRIGFLVSHRYSSSTPVTSKNILPSKVFGVPVLKYIVSRSLKRPRDVIDFVNCCIEQGIGREKISETMVRKAEGKYSRKRLKSLYDEWRGDYDSLPIQVKLLMERPGTAFVVSDFSESDVESIATEILKEECEDELGELCKEYLNGNLITWQRLRQELLYVLFKVGIVGLMIDRDGGVNYAGSDRLSIARAEIKSDTRVHVHPLFYRALGLRHEASGEG